MPGSLPLVRRRCAVGSYLLGWTRCSNADVDGEPPGPPRSRWDAASGGVQACPAACDSFSVLGSTPGSTTNQLVRGLGFEHVMLGIVQPTSGQTVQDTLRRLDKLHYLNHANNRFWLDTRPNPAARMEEHKASVQDRGCIVDRPASVCRGAVRQRCVRQHHVFTDGSGDGAADRLGAARNWCLTPHSAGGRKLPDHRPRGRRSWKNGDQPRFQNKNNELLALQAASAAGTYTAWRNVCRLEPYASSSNSLMAKRANASLEQTGGNAPHDRERPTEEWIVPPMTRPAGSLSEAAVELVSSAQELVAEVERAEGNGTHRRVAPIHWPRC